MRTSATTNESDRWPLFVAFELGSTWKLAFTIGRGQKARMRSITARDIEAVKEEFMAEYNFSITGIPRALDASRQTINELSRERRAISPELRSSVSPIRELA